MAAERERPLSAERLREATGEACLENVVRLDIIFERISGQWDGLHQCVNLRELCLIDTPGLVAVPALSFAPLLTRLTLTDQRITSLTTGGAEGLGSLPNLRELYLHNNQIAAVDGLRGCIGLQKLWLCGNRLRRLERMEQLPCLRELWLQSNLITEVAPQSRPGGHDDAGLGTCFNLQVLALAGNPLAQCEALSLGTLSELPALHDLSFTDPMFGRCPVADVAGYRDTIILQCRQVQTLDGLAVDSRVSIHRAPVCGLRVADDVLSI